MDQYTGEELKDALQVVSSAISRCEKSQPKFAEGTAQHTLLKNRLKALYISKCLISGEHITNQFSVGELAEALRPVSSIIRKCETAQRKHAEGSVHYARFQNMIQAMKIAKSLIEDECNKRG